MGDALAAWLVLATLATSTSPLATVQRSVAQILRSSELAHPLRSEKARGEIHTRARTSFDFSEMARQALPEHGKVYSSQEREEFLRLLAQTLEQSYLDMIQSAVGAEIVYFDESIDRGRAVVRSMILIAGRGAIPLEYRLHRTGARWIVYDVRIDSQSIAASYRTRLAPVGGANSPTDLLQRLRRGRALHVDPGQ